MFWFEDCLHFDKFNRRVRITHKSCDFLISCLYYNHFALFKYFVIDLALKKEYGYFDIERLARFILAKDQFDLFEWFTEYLWAAKVGHGRLLFEIPETFQLLRNDIKLAVSCFSWALTGGTCSSIEIFLLE